MKRTRDAVMIGINIGALWVGLIAGALLNPLEARAVATTQTFSINGLQSTAPPLITSFCASSEVGPQCQLMITAALARPQSATGPSTPMFGTCVLVTHSIEEAGALLRYIQNVSQIVTCADKSAATANVTIDIASPTSTQLYAF